MMNRFFTLLFAASCLTAVGQEQSVFLDGEDDYINVFIPVESNDFSFSVEVKMTDLPSTGVYIVDTRLDDQRGYFMWIRQDGLTDFGWENGQDNFDVVQVSLADVDWFNSWQEITIVQSGSALSLFVEGELKAELDGYLDAIASRDRMILGRRNNGPGHDFHGLMDNVFVGSGMLSVTDIQLAKCNGNSEGLGAGFWNLDNGATNSVGTNVEAYVQLENGASFVGFDSSEADCLCADISACNYSSSSITNDNCDYSCCPGPGCCGAGTTWNWQTSGCDVTNPSDSNFDGCVQLNDLLDLLSAYGDCGADESAWQCGDPLEYQGYDYETVQIGEQCWFAENLRAENYRNGDSIQASLSDAEWAGTAEGAVSVYDGDIANLSTYGRLYNWYAVVENRFLCPSQWHVPSDLEWRQLKAYATLLVGDGFEGTALKSTGGWFDFNGTDYFGFSALPGGVRASEINVFLGVGNKSSFWTSSSILNPNSYAAFHYQTAQGVGSYSGNRLHQDGLSVRCIKDAE